MGYFLDLANRSRQRRRALGDAPAPEATETTGPPDIRSARGIVKETRHLRDEWANACLSLAESQDWEPVEFKQGHKVSAGEYGWRIYCGVANLTQLRDQTYPALMDQRRLDRPTKGQMAVKMAVKTPLIETEWITAIRP